MAVLVLVVFLVSVNRTEKVNLEDCKGENHALGSFDLLGLL